MYPSFRNIWSSVIAILGECEWDVHVIGAFRDLQGSLAIVESARRGNWRFMIGDNQNLFDLTFVDNAAYAHILAADKLLPGKNVDGQVQFGT
jgi:3-beta hydroxysteroid dehydrogenase/isomerase family